MTNFTKGPWSVDANQNIIAAGGMVAITGIVDGDKQAGNALLIAAAPELLAAVQGAMKRLEYANRHIDCSDEIDASNSVIRKATGEQS